MSEAPDPARLAAELTALYGLGPETRVEQLGSGRHLFLAVDAPGRPPLFYKAALAPPAAAEAAEAALAFQAHVADRGGPAPAVIAPTGLGQGALLRLPSGAVGVLTERLTGRVCAATPSDARALGTALAAVHDLGDAWPDPAAARLPEAGRAMLLDAPLARIAAALDRPFDPAVLRLARALGDWLDRLPRSGPGFGPCHGDSHCENAAETADGRACFFDFEHAMRGWRAYDLATFIWGCFRLERGTETWNAFIEGYAARRPLSQAEADSIRAFLPLRHLWWLGFNAGTEGPLSHKMRDRLEEGLGFLLTLAEQVGVDEVLGAPAEAG